MNSRESEELFWRVFHSHSEHELHALILENAHLHDQNNWYPYGGRSKDDRSNFGTFENQQPNSGAALVEKVTNSIDALLLKRCKQEGIDPKSDNAPKTMELATARFFDIPKGDIGELSKSARAQMARDNIQIIATGDDTRPDLMIYDHGEGQHPNNFKNTFLSIANNNKTDIAFVQGKYNMGSTGAVVFCGEYRYQLIASKMDADVFNRQNRYEENVFGWTIVRKHILTEKENAKYGSSWYEYFAINGEHIPQFGIGELEIGLQDEKKFTTGSFIKLFSYEMPKGATGQIDTHLNRELNQLLYKPALPFWLYEKRDKYAPQEKIGIAVYGNHVRINKSDREDNVLEVPPIYGSLSSKEIGIITVCAIVFQKGKTQQQQTDRKRSYIGSSRNVIYTLNGQVQGHEGQLLITQKLNYFFLKESMLIVIDCSQVKTEFRQDLFMANRSNLRRSNKSETLREKVIELLRGNETLRELNTHRKNAVLRGGDSNEEMERIEKILSGMPLDKSLINLLKKAKDFTHLQSSKNKERGGGKEQDNAYESSRFPSIFKINLKDDKHSGKKVKSIPLNGKGIIKFETDVVADYFYRTHDMGRFELHIVAGKDKTDTPIIDPAPSPDPSPTEVLDFFDVDYTNPVDGSIKLTLRPRHNLNVGDEITLNAKLTSPHGDMESIFHVKIIDRQIHGRGTAKKEPEKLEIPKLIEVTRRRDGTWQQDNGTDWLEGEWDENSIIHVMPSAEGETKIVSAIAVNMDSYVLKRYLSNSAARTDKTIDHLKKQYIRKIYLHGLFLYGALDKLQAQKSTHGKYAHSEQNNEDLLAEIFKNYSSMLMHFDTNNENAFLEALNDE